MGLSRATYAVLAITVVVVAALFLFLGESDSPTGGAVIDQEREAVQKACEGVDFDEDGDVDIHDLTKCMNS